MPKFASLLLALYYLVACEVVAFAPSYCCTSLATKRFASGGDDDKKTDEIRQVANDDSMNDPTDVTTSPSLLPERNNEASPETPILLRLQSGFWFSVAGLAVAGVVFNLFGYAFTFDDGIFRFDTLRELRMERALDDQGMVEASAGGGISEFFFKNPFLATLMLTGIVLLYENVVYGGRKQK